MNAKREAFENHMRRENPCVRLARQSASLGGEYRTITVQRAWNLWRASWAIATYEAQKYPMQALPVIDPRLLEVGK